VRLQVWIARLKVQGGQWQGWILSRSLFKVCWRSGEQRKERDSGEGGRRYSGENQHEKRYLMRNSNRTVDTESVTGIFVSFVVLGFELRALLLWGRCATSWGTPPVVTGILNTGCQMAGLWVFHKTVWANCWDTLSLSSFPQAGWVSSSLNFYLCNIGWANSEWNGKQSFHPATTSLPDSIKIRLSPPFTGCVCTGRWVLAI
jgi:hypothetical protein